MAKQKIPWLARGDLETLRAALTDGVFKDLDRTIYCYITSGEGAGCMAFVDPEKEIHIIKGNNTIQYQPVEELPETGEINILYRLDNTIYFWNGEQYVPSYQDVTDRLSIAEGQIQTLSTDLDNLITATENAFEEINTNFNTIQNSIEGINETLQDHTDALQELNTIVDGHTESLSEITNQITTINNGLDDISNSQSDLSSAIQDLQNNKADKATTLAGYNIEDAYSKDEVDDIIGSLSGEEISVTQYVNNAAQGAKDYADSLLVLEEV